MSTQHSSLPWVPKLGFSTTAIITSGFIIHPCFSCLELLGGKACCAFSALPWLREWASLSVLGQHGRHGSDSRVLGGRHITRTRGLLHWYLHHCKMLKLPSESCVLLKVFLICLPQSPEGASRTYTCSLYFSSPCWSWMMKSYLLKTLCPAVFGPIPHHHMTPSFHSLPVKLPGYGTSSHKDMNLFSMTVVRFESRLF